MVDPHPHPHPPHIPDPLGVLAQDVPLVLLPVRLETRWFDVSDPSRIELRIRVLPDEIHIAPPLAVGEGERELVAAYFAARTEGGDDAERTKQCYARLVERAGASRAAWLVRALASGAPPVPDLHTDDSRVRVSAMPRRWIAVAKAPGLRAVATGEPIPADLFAAPHRSDDRSTPDAFLGDSLAWLTNFKKAVAVGMGLRMTFARTDAARLDELIVVGLAADPDQTSAAFGELLERHAGGDGAALLPWGTPTNVSDDRTEVRAGGQRGPWRGGGSRPLLPIGTTPGTDAARTLSALGVAADAAPDLVADDIDRAALARAMNTVMWPATWAPILSDDANLPATAVDEGRRLFIENVRPTGPFPSLRVRSQPYGVLPVTSLARWPQAAPHSALVAFLQRVSTRWQSAIDKVPRLVDSSDLDRDLVAILRRHPASSAAWVREVLTADTASILMADPMRVRAALHALHLQQSAAFGLPAELGVVFDRVFDDHARRLGIPFVAPPSASREARLPHDYLTAIADAPLQALRDHTVEGATPRTLLYFLARHAAIRLRSQARPPIVASDPVVVAHSISVSVWTRMELLGAFALSNAGVLELAAALRWLGRQPVGELEAAFSGALDASAYRVDAWRTAIASERLTAVRTAQPARSYIGGWGYLERPRPSTRPAPRGYLHAPSPAQARTAATLRAGYEAHRLDDNGTSLAIDLSSTRTRDARWLLSAVREGRPLAGLLGDFVERTLLASDPNHDILELRRMFIASGAPVPDVTDGWLVYHTWKAHRPAAPRGEAFDALRDLLDGVSDLLLADSVHHAIAGSHARAAAALDALQRGEVATPEPRVDRTDTDGARTSRRVVLLLGDGPGWPGPVRPRAAAHPRLEALSARVLGNPSAVAIMVTDSVSASPPTTAARTLADLDVCALDVVALTASGSDRALLEFAAATVSVVEGATRTIAGDPALDELVLRAAALARLFRGAATPVAGDLGEVIIDAPADRSTVVANSLAQLAASPRTALAALVGPALAANPSALAAAGTALAGNSADAIASVVGSGFAQPARIGTIASLPPHPLANNSPHAFLSDVARVRSALEPLDLLALIAPDVIPCDLRMASDGVEILLAGTHGSSSAGVDALVVDSWSDAAPAATIKTGVAFPFDAPRTQPPQTILIAVPPPSTSWSLPLVEAIIDETLAAARLRVIAPEDVRGQLLPAILVADDPDELVPSLDLGLFAATVQLEVMQ